MTKTQHIQSASTIKGKGLVLSHLWLIRKRRVINKLVRLQLLSFNKSTTAMGSKASYFIPSPVGSWCKFIKFYHILVQKGQPNYKSISAGSEISTTFGIPVKPERLLPTFFQDYCATIEPTLKLSSKLYPCNSERITGINTITNVVQIKLDTGFSQ